MGASKERGAEGDEAAVPGVDVLAVVDPPAPLERESQVAAEPLEREPRVTSVARGQAARTVRGCQRGRGGQERLGERPQQDRLASPCLTPHQDQLPGAIGADCVEQPLERSERRIPLRTAATQSACEHIEARE